MVESIVLNLGIILLITLVIAIILRAFNQPVMMAYILAAFIVSPFVANLMAHDKVFEPFAEIGISLLLFLVGLNLNPSELKGVGKVSLITGVGQMIFTTVLGYFLALFIGFSSISSLYIGLALAFSSTIIVMKVLSDKDETNTLHGKISIGFLIVQDLVHVFIIFGVLIVGKVALGTEVIDATLSIFGVGFLLIFGFLLFSYFILPKVTSFLAKSQEMLLLFSLSWALIISAIFYSLGLTLEIGALLAGVCLSFSQYRYEISSKLTPLKDFFLIVFFISLAPLLAFSSLIDNIVPIILLSLLVLIGNPLIVLFTMGSLGYTKRNSFLAGLTVAQISEFSFILVALGVSLGHITSEILSIVVAVGVITIAGSYYMMIYANPLYNKLSRVLSIFEKNDRRKGIEDIKCVEDYDVVLFGYNRMGYDLLENFLKKGYRTLVVDYNPDTVTYLRKRGINCIYGDAEDIELLNEIHFRHVKMVVSTILDDNTNRMLLERLKDIRSDILFIGVSNNLEGALKLYEMGSDYVITPSFLGGVHTSDLINKNEFDSKKYQKEAKKDRAYLRKRLREHNVLLYKKGSGKRVKR